MTVGSPRHWFTNDVISATRWNAETRDQANGQFFKPTAMIAKTVLTEWASVDQMNGLEHSLANIQFDKVVYDRSYDGSKMAYGSSLMVNIPGYYLIRARFTWSTTNTTNTATPTAGTRHLGIGINMGGKWQTTRFLAPDESQRVSWVSDPPISPPSTTPLIQPVRGQARVKLQRGDIIEAFAGQDSLDTLFDAPIDSGENANATSTIFTMWLKAEWRGRSLS